MKYKKILLFSISLVAVNAYGSGLGNVDSILKSKSCFDEQFASYSSWVNFLQHKNHEFDLSRFRVAYPEKEFESYRNQLDCVFFSYEVDGLEIGGFAAWPAQAENLPAIVFNRGGTGTFGQVTFAQLFSNVFYLAKQGYLVIGSQYRGGMGKPESVGGFDEWGGSDVKDVMQLFSILENLDFVDKSRIGMWGGSRGSINMFQAAIQRTDIRAIVSVSGVYDLEHELNFRPSMERVFKKHIPNFETNRGPALARRSVVKWIEHLDANTPILLIHAVDDQRASTTGVLSFARSLQEQFRTYRLVVFEDGGHFLRKQRDSVREEVLNWFGKYI